MANNDNETEKILTDPELPGYVYDPERLTEIHEAMDNQTWGPNLDDGKYLLQSAIFLGNRMSDFADQLEGTVSYSAIVRALSPSAQRHKVLPQADFRINKDVLERISTELQDDMPVPQADQLYMIRTIMWLGVVMAKVVLENNLLKSLMRR